MRQSMFAEMFDERVWSSRGFRASAVAFMLVVAFLAAPAVLESSARLALRRMHLDLPFPVWAVLQAQPAMYNHYNTIFFQPLHGAPDRWARYPMNHHPTRAIYEVGRHQPLKSANGCYKIIVKTNFQSLEKTSKFVACSDGKLVYTVGRAE